MSNQSLKISKIYQNLNLKKKPEPQERYLLIGCELIAEKRAPIIIIVNTIIMIMMMPVLGAYSRPKYISMITLNL